MAPCPSHTGWNEQCEFKCCNSTRRSLPLQFLHHLIIFRIKGFVRWSTNWFSDPNFVTQLSYVDIGSGLYMKTTVLVKLHSGASCMHK